MDSGVKVIFTVMPMFCTCHLVKSCVNTLGSREIRMPVIYCSVKLHVADVFNLKRKCCKTRWKNKFYATSLLHPHTPCMMHPS